MTSLCAICNKPHETWPPDLAFSRPDLVWNMPHDERSTRVMETDDYCIVDGARHFIRSVLLIELVGHDDFWGIGLWVEVSPADYQRYCDLYAEDGTGAEPLTGTIANHLAAFPHAFCAVVNVHLGDTGQRPILIYQEPTDDLAIAQHNGVNDQQLHKILAVERPELLERKAS